jgi:hypothetical protein
VLRFTLFYTNIMINFIVFKIIRYLMVLPLSLHLSCKLFLTFFIIPLKLTKFDRAASVIFSRLYNGYHSPLDVCGGALIGFLTVLTWYASIRYWYDTFLMWNSIYGKRKTKNFFVLFLKSLKNP